MIGFLGGTGPEGRGLALRLALAGEDVIIGSRDAGRAATAAEEVAELAPGAVVEGAVNEEAAARAEVVFVAVPYSAQRSTIEPLAGHLAGKVVVGVTVPVRFGKGGASIEPVPDGSAALEIEALLPDSRVVAAFQTISAHDLLDPNRTVDSDVVVCSNDEGARAQVMELSNRIAGIRAVDGGGLANAVHVEGMTALILNLNRRYKARAAFRITGI